jgi:uncharacterized protein YecT (DUF1311 family)
MMRFLLPVLMIAIPVTTTAVRADDCSKAQSQAALGQCADKAFHEADKKLNTAYQQIETRLKDDAAATKLLIAAQRAWISFRDAECSFQGGPVDEAGSIYPMTVANCKAALTGARLKDFDAYLHCQEGDTSCPVPGAQ